MTLKLKNSKKLVHYLKKIYFIYKKKTEWSYHGIIWHCQKHSDSEFYFGVLFCNWDWIIVIVCFFSHLLYSQFNMWHFDPIANFF